METNGTAETLSRTSTTGHRRWRSAALLAVLAALGLGVAACGGAAPSGVASTGHSRYGQSVSNFDSTALEYTACMRKHGVLDFPEPIISDNGLQISFGGGASKPRRISSNLEGASSLAVYNKATEACYEYSPSYEPPGLVSQSYLKEMLVAAECLRAHGVPGFPDPTTNLSNRADVLHMISVNGVYFVLPKGSDQLSPLFTRAEAACHFPPSTPGP